MFQSFHLPLSFPTSLPALALNSFPKSHSVHLTPSSSLNLPSFSSSNSLCQYIYNKKLHALSMILTLAFPCTQFSLSSPIYNSTSCLALYLPYSSLHCLLSCHIFAHYLFFKVPHCDHLLIPLYILVKLPFTCTIVLPSHSYLSVPLEHR